MTSGPDLAGRWGRLTEPVFLLGTLALTTVGTVFSLRLWQADPRVPFVLSGDAGFVGTMVKTTLDQGWYLNNPALGAPFGVQFHDIPYGADNLQLLMIKALGLVSHDWALVMNAYFLLTFALVAAAAYVVFRQLRLSTWTSAGLATLFSLLPFHFFNGQTFLWVSGYFAVPLGAFLVLDALGWDVWGPPLPARVADEQPAQMAGEGDDVRRHRLGRHLLRALHHDPGRLRGRARPGGAPEPGESGSRRRSWWR